MSKSRQEDDIFYGDHAETVINNPAYQQALIRMKAKLFENFGKTGIFQRRKREELWKMKRILDDFEQEFEIMLRDKAIAEHDLKKEQKLHGVRI